MTDNEMQAPPPKRRFPYPSLLAAVAALLLLTLLGAGAYGGWYLWRASHETEDDLAAQQALMIRVSRQLSEAQSQIEQLRDRQTDLTDAEHAGTDDLAKLQGRSDDLEQALQHLSADVKGGRTRAQLIAIEQLLLMANDRAQIAHDARGATAALQLAEERLAALSEPRLIDVRKAVAEERAALLAVPLADRGSAALNLSGLIDRAGALPLRDRPPVLALAPEAPPVPSVAVPGVWGRGMASLRELFHAVFTVRRTDRPVDRLLPPEQQTLVQQLLALKLESARAALLQGDTASFRGALDSALRWLADYYRPEDPAVRAARTELERLRGLELDPPLPDLSHSLGLLRAYLDAMPR